VLAACFCKKNATNVDRSSSTAGHSPDGPFRNQVVSLQYFVEILQSIISIRRLSYRYFPAQGGSADERTASPTSQP
jgi:hypothetical protein